MPSLSSPSTAAPESGASPLIHLSLAAIARSLPPGMAGESLKALPPSVRVAFPFAWIEPQLAKGAVELPRDRFVEALPGDVRPDFHLADDTPVALPLEEILLNLPGETSGEKQPPPASGSACPTIEEPRRGVVGQALPLAGGVRSAAVDQWALQSLFMTEDDLDLEKIAGFLRALPGLAGCIAASGAGSASAGEIPGPFRSADIRQIASGLFQSAGEHLKPLGLGEVRSQTLECAER